MHSPTLLQRLFRQRPSKSGARTHADRTIAFRLYRTFELELERAQVQGVHFFVLNGTVTLCGAITHMLDRDLLISLVEQVEGVTEVVSQLQLLDAKPVLEASAEG